MTNIKIGVLGAGQLGRMLQQEASTMNLNLHFLDKDPTFPAGQLSHNFVKGDFTNYDDVLSFGKDKDIVTIEIENVNTDALKALQDSGVQVYPQPEVVEIIKDKGRQKEFYKSHNLPSSNFILVNNKSEILDKINSGKLSMPFVQKSRLAGYDGKGVKVVHDKNDFNEILEAPSVIEELVDIKKELAVIAVRNKNGEIITFPLTEMVFNPKGNLLDYLICPAEVSENITTQCKDLAKDIIEKLDMVGILAVELFLTKNGEILINEVAPRTHNSGHHTINANKYSQFNLHLRSILNLDLKNVGQIRPYAGMLNILGDINTSTGTPHYHGLKDILNLDEVYPHLYGKTIVKPLRKMGHVNINAASKDDLIQKINIIKQKLIVNNGE